MSKDPQPGGFIKDSSEYRTTIEIGVSFDAVDEHVQMRGPLHDTGWRASSELDWGRESSQFHGERRIDVTKRDAG